LQVIYSQLKSEKFQKSNNSSSAKVAIVAKRAPVQHKWDVVAQNQCHQSIPRQKLPLK